MNIVEKITNTIEPSLAAMGYALVQVKLSDGARRKTLTVMAERADGKAMSFDDCSNISQAAGALLEVEDPIATAYDLEVCSPGIDRPLTRREDFTRFAGQEAKIETMIPIDGRRKFRGQIEGIRDDVITLKMSESVRRHPDPERSGAKGKDLRQAARDPSSQPSAVPQDDGTMLEGQARIEFRNIRNAKLLVSETLLKKKPVTSN